MAKPVDTLPKEYQGRRVFHGMMPEYYEKVLITKTSPTLITFNFYHHDFRTGVQVLCGTIEIEYEDATMEFMVRAEKTFPPTP